MLGFEMNVQRTFPSFQKGLMGNTDTIKQRKRKSLMFGCRRPPEMLVLNLTVNIPRPRDSTRNASSHTCEQQPSLHEPFSPRLAPKATRLPHLSLCPLKLPLLPHTQEGTVCQHRPAGDPIFPHDRSPSSSERPASHQAPRRHGRRLAF